MNKMIIIRILNQFPQFGQECWDVGWRARRIVRWHRLVFAQYITFQLTDMVEEENKIKQLIQPRHFVTGTRLLLNVHNTAI